MAAQAPRLRDLRSAGRRGITLLELLVVMVILSIVTAASIPMLTTGVEQRRVREAARLVASYIGAARSRAIETGNPAGVMIQRAAGQQYALTLVGVEVPQPYAGDCTNSTAVINGGQLTGFLLGDSGWNQTVRVGDLVRFGYQGRSYMLLGNSPLPNINSALPNMLSNTTGQNIGGQLLSSTGFPGTLTPVPCNLWATDGSGATPPATSAGGIPFQIYRQPVKSAVQPLQLPEGTVIDLSTIGSVGSTIGLRQSFTGAYPYPSPIITFGPSGAVNLVYYNANPPQHPVNSLYFLVGRREGVHDVNPGGDPNNPTNIHDTNNMWVAVRPQSGQVITAENAGAYGTDPRQFAQAASSLGGR